MNLALNLCQEREQESLQEPSSSGDCFSDSFKNIIYNILKDAEAPPGEEHPTEELKRAMVREEQRDFTKLSWTVIRESMTEAAWGCVKKKMNDAGIAEMDDACVDRSVAWYAVFREGSDQEAIMRAFGFKKVFTPEEIAKLRGHVLMACYVALGAMELVGSPDGAAPDEWMQELEKFWLECEDKESSVNFVAETAAPPSIRSSALTMGH